MIIHPPTPSNDPSYQCFLIWMDDPCPVCNNGTTRWDCQKHSPEDCRWHLSKLKRKAFEEYNEALKKDKKNRRMPA